MGAFERLLHRLATAPTAAALKLAVVDGAARAVEGDITGLYFFDEGGRALSEVFATLPDCFVFEYEELARSNDLCFARALRTGRAAHERMAWTVEGWHRSVQYRAFAKRFGIYHYLCAPIISDGRLVGTLNLGRSREGKPFAAPQVARAQTVVDAIAARLGEAEAGPGKDARLQVARWRAARAALRCAPRLEDQAPLLSEPDAAELWEAIGRGDRVPIDTFDAGDRRYLLLPVEDSQPLANALSAREREVVRRVGAGETNKSIAYDLQLSTSVVAKVVSAARRKLGVAARVELARLGRRLPGA